MTAPLSTKLSDTSVSQFSVSLLEGVGIAVGALLLVMAAWVGLAEKAVRNATDSRRAEAIARSLISYDIPGGSRGVFGINIGSVKMAVVTSPPLPSSPLFSVELLIARTPVTVTEAEPTDPPPATPDNFDLVSFGGFSVSYDLEGQFRSQTTQQQQKPFCNNPVPVTVRRGSITADLGGPALPAVRYEATTTLDNREHQIILTAVGENSGAIAEQVFLSLHCR